MQVVTDPALAWKKAKELYAALSGPEPENQARPATLEELLVLLSRETARRVVHFINYVDLPNNLHLGLTVAVSVDSALSGIRIWRQKITALLQQLQDTSKVYLEHLAMLLAGNDGRHKLSSRSIYDQRDDLSTINGVN
ncbi:unnamed protein product [Leptidea sinapis]|uniref:Uncharacterized protein n=1 Tax=Leptidea sinapis TaxID=189913 RepID=A0A5E4QP32_9NEOP|nr:unnamed protein product [Leptidea sinapis]